VIAETDDFVCHQTIEPHAYVALNDLRWGERAYHTLSDLIGSGWTSGWRPIRIGACSTLTRSRRFPAGNGCPAAMNSFRR